YAQGMALIAAGAREWRWSIDLGEMARIWTGGCIIRARLLDDLMRAFTRAPALANLLIDPDLGAALADSQASLRAVVAAAQARGAAPRRARPAPWPTAGCRSGAARPSWAR